MTATKNKPTTPINTCPCCGKENSHSFDDKITEWGVVDAGDVDGFEVECMGCDTTFDIYLSDYSKLIVTKQ